MFDRRQVELPGGRLVAGVTETPIGAITVVGVCIPWSGAHVAGGRRDRVRWQDHLAWLSGFERLSFARSRRRTVVLGDFNQRSPKGGKLHSALQEAFERFRISTAGFLTEAPSTLVATNGVELWKVGLSDAKSVEGVAQLIDHIAHSEDLALHQPTPKLKGISSVGIFPNEQDGSGLSDHIGVWVDLKKA